MTTTRRYGRPKATKIRVPLGRHTGENIDIESSTIAGTAVEDITAAMVA
jgi:hypothetical protein